MIMSGFDANWMSYTQKMKTGKKIFNRRKYWHFNMKSHIVLLVRFNIYGWWYNFKQLVRQQWYRRKNELIRRKDISSYPYPYDIRIFFRRMSSFFRGNQVNIEFHIKISVLTANVYFSSFHFLCVEFNKSTRANILVLWSINIIDQVTKIYVCSWDGLP